VWGDVGGWRIEIKDPVRQDVKIFTLGEREAGHFEKTFGVIEGIGIGVG